MREGLIRVDLLVDRYRRERSLGRGATGEVWLAEDTLLGRPVAIKQLRTDPDATPGQWAERMRREARLAAQLNHPNAVAVYDLVIADEQPYVVMEYVPGESLAQRIRRASRLSPDEAARWIGQVAAALEAAHARGVVHRDVKPANILITPDGSAKLADFGIARSVQDVSQTTTGVTVGTPGYLAPEVARGSDPAPASDVWSLGATLYATVEGKPPFGSGVDNPLALLSRIQAEPVPRPVSAGPLLPVLAAMLDRDPARRPSAGQVRSWLTSQGPVPGESDPDPTQQRPVPPPTPTAAPPPTPAVAPPPYAGPPSVALPGHGYGFGAQPPAPARPRRSGWLLAGIILAVLIVAGGVITAVALSSKSAPSSRASTPASTSSSPDFPSTSASATPSSPTPTRPTTAATRRATVAPKPTDVPSLPATGQAVPIDAKPPGPPLKAGVRPYTSPDPTPTSARQIIEWQPPGLGGDALAAVSSVTRFVVEVNQQDFQKAWDDSTEIHHGATPDQKFRSGYRTSRHYQLAFGQPRRLDRDLFAIPARFVSRQNPAAQGNPAGVTGCTYWPQYVFLVANVNGRWLDDVAGDYVGRPSVASLKRADTIRKQPELLPLQQRVAC
jgi:hypothetical protein